MINDKLDTLAGLQSSITTKQYKLYTIISPATAILNETPEDMLYFPKSRNPLTHSPLNRP